MLLLGQARRFTVIIRILAIQMFDMGALLKFSFIMFQAYHSSTITDCCEGSMRGYRINALKKKSSTMKWKLKQVVRPLPRCVQLVVTVLDLLAIAIRCSSYQPTMLVVLWLNVYRRLVFSEELLSSPGFECCSVMT